MVEASAITGVGVTATLRAAIARILDNLKNNVDTTLYEEPELRAPDLSVKSGVAAHSAGTPKLSMKSEPAQPAAPPPAAVPPPVFEQAPFGAAIAPEPLASPFDTGEHHVEVEDDPFGQVAVAEPEPAGDFDDPFAEPAVEIHDAEAERAHAEELLANARALVASLEAALERARENVRIIESRR